MPERPELDGQRERLSEEVVGLQITNVAVCEPLVLRRMLDASAARALTGQAIARVRRRVHFILFDLQGPAPATLMAVHPMLAGRSSLGDPDARLTKDTVLRLCLSDGRELRYRDEERMGKVYLARTADEAQIPGLAQTGDDVLAPNFTVERLAAIARGRKEQLKTFLLDKGALDALANAYADEALFAARLHPKRRVNELSQAELAALRAGTIEVLSEAAAAVRDARPPLAAKLRGHLRVRNKMGQPCRACGGPIRVCGVNGHDAFFCGACQVDPAGRGMVNWSTLAQRRDRG